MTKASLPKPRYSIWNAIASSLALAQRAIDEVRALARLPGPQGERGERGLPGFSLSDFSVTSPDEGRTLVFMFAQGKDVQKHIVKSPVVLYRGIWRQEYIDEHGCYEKGDQTTRDGSQWIALENTTDPPGTGSKTWQLSNKKGRDGKDGPAGPHGQKGEPGRNGRDLTQMGTDGKKW